MSSAELANVTQQLLQTPGVTKVVFAWVDPDMDRWCLQEVHPGDPVDTHAMPNVRKSVYLVGRFAFGGLAGDGDISSVVNDVRIRAGLQPIRCAMFSELRTGSSGLWAGIIKVNTAASFC